MTRKVIYSPEYRLKKMKGQKFLYNGRMVRVQGYRINDNKIHIKTDRWLITCTRKESSYTLNQFLEIDFK